jgi:hypothetical protein
VSARSGGGGWAKKPAWLLKLEEQVGKLAADHLDEIAKDEQRAEAILEANMGRAEDGERDAAVIVGGMMKARSDLRGERMDLFRPNGAADVAPAAAQLEEDQAERLRRLLTQLSPAEQRAVGILAMDNAVPEAGAIVAAAAVATHDDASADVPSEDDQGGTPEVTH